MAGQPPEPSWPPAGQDQTQIRAWPPPPPPQQPQGYPPPPAYAAPEQAYQGQDQGYPGPDPTQWQAVPDRPAGRPGQPRAHGEKGFLGSLFDFSFSSFVTPKIIKVLYILFTIWTALVSLILLIVGFRTGGMAGGLFMLIVIVPIYVLLTLGVYRIILEAFMVVFRIYEETKKISARGESHV